MALFVVGRLAHTSGRGELLFLDGDSQIVRLIVRSVLSGEPLDWAMSPVLFIPESVLYAVLSVSRLDMHGMAVLSAVVNVVLLYACLRFVTGRGLGSVAGIARAGTAYGVYAAATLLEGPGGRDALELSSLLITTTYYSGTIFGVLLLVVLAARAVSGARSRTALLVAAFSVSAISTLSNPLFVAWGTVPVLLILAVMMRTSERRDHLIAFAGASVVGALAGFAARIPLGPFIVADDSVYFQPTRVGESLVYYGSLVADRVASPEGALSVLCAVALVVLGIVATFRSSSHVADAGDRLVLAFAWVAPIGSAIGFVLLGTHAARYLEPWAFASVLCLAALPPFRARPAAIPATALRAGVAVVAVAVTVLGVVGVASLGSSRPDPSLACVTDWVNAQDRVGAGQFWSIRAIKANIDRPGQLLQVDQAMNAYGWLVNRHDFDARDVHFLITDDQSFDVRLPAGSSVPAPRIVDCGRWTIADYGDRAIRVSPVQR